MRSYGLTAAALVALATATPATAMPAGAPGALRGAIEDQATNRGGALPARLGALAPLGLGHRLLLSAGLSLLWLLWRASAVCRPSLIRPGLLWPALALVGRA